MDIQERHIASKRRIGTLRGQPVVELMTKGGLCMVVSQKDGKLDTLGAGPHRAVARYIASKRAPEMVITELSKSDWVDEASILSVYDRYLALTQKLNDLVHRDA